MANAKLDTEQALEIVKRMSADIDEIQQQSVSFNEKVSELKERTNMPSVASILNITQGMKDNLTVIKENADVVLKQMSDYAAEVEAIANGTFDD